MAQAATPAGAAVLTWNGAGGNSTWATPANWGGASIAARDSLVFAGSTRLNATNNYTSLVPLASISFAANAGAFIQNNIASASTSVASGITNASSNLQTFNLRLGVAGNQTWDGGSAGMLFNGAVTLGSNNLVLANKVAIDNASLSFAVGDTGTAALTVGSGSAVQANFGQLGTAAAAVGTLTVTGAGSTWASAAGLDVGGVGVGGLNVAAGGAVTSGVVFIGRDSSGAALASSAKVSGAGSSWTSTSDIYVNNGSLLVDNGAAVSAVNAFAALYSRGTGSITVQGTGSQFNVSNGIFLGTDDAGTTGTLNLLAGASASAPIIQVGNQGVLNLDGGTLNLVNSADSNNAGSFVWTGGLLHFSGDASFADASLLARNTTLTGAMSLRVDGLLTQSDSSTLSLAGGQLQVGSTNLYGQVTVGQGSSFSATTRLSNIGSLQLAGGTISSTGIINNGNYWSGYGVIAGAGRFINTGLLQQSGGRLELATLGDNVNYGNWDMLDGRGLVLSGGNLNNAGTMRLNGDTISGTALLTNELEGTLSGRGVITTRFQNDGRIVIDSGSLRIVESFNNTGQILLGSNSATLSGGVISNSGHIEGFGSINNALNNTGTLEAIGGTLALNGSLSNSGTIIVDNGARVRLNQGLNTNSGRIQLAGGTFDNNGYAMTNATGATISGAGTLRGGTLTNQGKLQLSGGTSSVYADVLNRSGQAAVGAAPLVPAGQIILSGNSNTTFYGKVDVQSGAELRVSTGSVATFFGDVQQRTGAKFTGSGSKRFEGLLTVGASPGLGTDEGDVEFGDAFTYVAEIGGITACTLACENNLAVINSSFDKYSVAGSLSFNGTLFLTSWNGFVAQAGQSFDLFDWGTRTGEFSDIDASGFKLAAGTQLDTSRLYADGSISVTAVPEPETYAMMLAGLGLVGWSARRRANRA
jgi:T5SS/PEP-CTERM-associated repeat protein